MQVLMSALSAVFGRVWYSYSFKLGVRITRTPGVI